MKDSNIKHLFFRKLVARNFDMSAFNLYICRKCGLRVEIFYDNGEDITKLKEVNEKRPCKIK